MAMSAPKPPIRIEGTATMLDDACRALAARNRINPAPKPCDDAELRKLLIAMRRNLIAANKIAEKIEAMVDTDDRKDDAA